MAIEFPNIDPVAFSIGPVAIRWYALAYMAGFLLGWKYIVTLIRKYYGEDKDARGRALTVLDIDDFLPWGIAGVILGGRLGYVLFYQFEMYMAEPLQILQVWQGGMSFHGGAMGAIAAMILFAWKRKLPLLRLTDLVCCAVPIGLFFGRIANFINGELYGRAGNVPWAMEFPYGGEVLRHPSQLYEAALEGAVLFMVLLWLVRQKWVREHAGFISGVFLIGYGVTRFIVEFFREPDVQIGLIGGVISMGQILCLPMMIGGAVAIAVSMRRSHEQTA
ncbi:MAG: prolipoprotein diacylglyceryl transferase [Alphaproteobacteria bacterium]|nr:prolipoprotein diacylglyceryl transferase [Alphaproteobacteria bacterium]